MQNKHSEHRGLPRALSGNPRLRPQLLCLPMLLTLALAACGGGGSTGAATCGAPPGGASAGAIRAGDAWSWPVTALDTASGGGAGANGVVYLTICNSGDEPDQLVDAQSDVASKAELHGNSQTGAVVDMRPVESIELAAHSEVKLRSGGFHLMLVGLRRDLKPGDHFGLSLRFARAGALPVQVEVRQP